MNKQPQVRIGTAGWNYRHWRGAFYPADLPAARWFEYYRTVFETVEINNTFYHLPAARTFAQWGAQAPRDFVYAVKANRYLTHLKKLKNVRQPLARFLRRASRLGRHLGPVLYQLPPHWKRDLNRLAKFCQWLPGVLTHVIEFRERDWLGTETFALLEQYGVSLCIHDLLDRHPHRVTGHAVYVRFHGSGRRYGGRYPRSQLQQWARWLRQQALAGHEVYAYFNNDANAHAVRDALALRALVQV